MMPSLEWVLRGFHLGLLRCASLLAPGRRRAEWYREWQAELWHMRRECTPSGAFTWSGERKVVSFCRGAFQDAVCLMRQAWQDQPPLAEWRGSAALCVLTLSALLTVAYAVASLSPGVRAERSVPGYRIYQGVVLILDARHEGDSSPAVSGAEFQTWKARRQKYFDGFAFYRVTRETVSAASHAQAAWGVAHSSSNLFALLDLPIRFSTSAGEAGGGLPRVILSDALWRREFRADPHVAGRVTRVGPRNARIAGVAPHGCWRLAGNVDAWLLEPDPAIASRGEGYVVVHLTSLGESALWASRLRITSYRPDGSENDLVGLSLDDGTSTPWCVYLFAVVMAFLTLPGTASVSMGEYSFSSQRPSRWRRLSRWGFLSAKIALLLLFGYFASLDLTYSWTTIYSPSSEIIHFAFSFSICLFGLRWAVLDQRQRCPVCLRRVAHPAQVGYSSRAFLAWNGTELICVSGHTLLQIPGLPTSWFSTQRWLYLDTSWQFLFADSSVG